MKKRYVAVFGDVPALVEYFQGDYTLTKDINKAKIYHSTKDLYWELNHSKCTGLNRRLPTHKEV